MIKYRRLLNIAKETGLDEPGHSNVKTSHTLIVKLYSMIVTMYDSAISDIEDIAYDVDKALHSTENQM